MKRRLMAGAAVLPILLATAACGGKATESGQSTDGMKTGPGVTAQAIKLGALVDLTAVFAPLGKSMVQGINLYWNQQNKAGGVCGRQVEVTIKDHGYDPQKAIALYREMSSEVVGLQTVLGSPVITALRPSIDQDNMLVGLAGWTSAVLPDPRIKLVGTTYEIEVINGLEHLLDEGVIKSGDKIGHVYFEGDFGETALRGAEHVAGQKNLTIVKQKIKPTDTDLTAQVTAFSSAGVKAIVISAGPTQTASLAGVAKSSGLDVPILSNGPGFTPQLLTTPAGDALKRNLYVVSSMAPLSVGAQGVKTVADAFNTTYPGQTPTQVGSTFGYTQAQVTKAILDKACQNKDLTRQGVLDAASQTSGLDTGGLVAGTLDYSKPGQPPSRAVYMARPDSDALDGLKVVGDPIESDLAKSYQTSP